MKAWNNRIFKDIRFTNLELLVAVLTFSLVIYIGSILPSYMEQIKVLQEEKNTYKERVQILKDYESKEEEWKMRDRFLDLSLEGYQLDFPKGIDEYFLLGVLEGYLNQWALEDLTVNFEVAQDTPPFKNYIYKVRYISNARTTKDIVYALPHSIEGISIQKFHIRALSTRKYAAEIFLAIRCQ